MPFSKYAFPNNALEKMTVIGVIYFLRRANLRY